MQVSAYIHFPYCLAKCPYCDFASTAMSPGQIQHERYADAVLRELDAKKAALKRATLASVFFGGGTPSLWDSAQLGRVLNGLRAAFEEEVPELEITAECNPSSLDAEVAEGLAAAGVNRLSVGVQSLRQPHLDYLGRFHDAEQARHALCAAAPIIPRLSADLIFGMPGLPASDFLRDVDEILGLGVEHLSAYALTVEKNTPFYLRKKKGSLPIAAEDDYANIFESNRAHLTRAGFHHYEVSNFAKPGAEARHNLNYWRGLDYLGLGAGAVQLMDGARARNARDAEKYMADPIGSVVFREELSPKERMSELWMMGLRLAEGVDLERARRRGYDLLAGREKTVEKQIALGNLIREGDTLRVPHERWLMLDSIVVELF